VLQNAMNSSSTQMHAQSLPSQSQSFYNQPTVMSPVTPSSRVADHQQGTMAALSPSHVRSFNTGGSYSSVPMSTGVHRNFDGATINPQQPLPTDFNVTSAYPDASLFPAQDSNGLTSNPLVQHPTYSGGLSLMSTPNPHQQQQQPQEEYITRLRASSMVSDRSSQSLHPQSTVPLDNYSAPPQLQIPTTPRQSTQQSTSPTSSMIGGGSGGGSSGATPMSPRNRHLTPPAFGPGQVHSGGRNAGVSAVPLVPPQSTPGIFGFFGTNNPSP